MNQFPGFFKGRGNRLCGICTRGVRTLNELLKMKEAGATCSGATTAEVMLKDAMQRFGDK